MKQKKVNNQELTRYYIYPTDENIERNILSALENGNYLGFLTKETISIVYKGSPISVYEIPKVVAERFRKDYEKSLILTKKGPDGQVRKWRESKPKLILKKGLTKAILKIKTTYSISKLGGSP